MEFSTCDLKDAQSIVEFEVKIKGKIQRSEVSSFHRSLDEAMMKKIPLVVCRSDSQAALGFDDSEVV